jgi:hypothetical protein
MKVTNHDLNELLFWSYRYAMGRQTYVPSLVADLLIKYKHELTFENRNKIALEIDRRIKRGEAGDNCDIKNWLKVRKELLKEV